MSPKTFRSSNKIQTNQDKNTNENSIDPELTKIIKKRLVIKQNFNGSFNNIHKIGKMNELKVNYLNNKIF
jgi:hypothetical protein